MSTTSWPGEPGETSGRCRLCGKTYVDAHGFLGDVLPEYVPVRLIKYGETEETTVGEWCSQLCFTNDLARHVQTARAESCR